MNSNHEFLADDILLAKLAVAKLAKLMHGLLSVGLGAMAMERHTGVGFMSGRDRVPLAFLEVIRCTLAKPELADRIEQLVEKLTEAMNRFYCLFLKLAEWREISAQDVRACADRLADNYSDLCRLLGELSSLVGLDTDFSDQAQQDRNYLDAVIATLPLEAPKMSISVRG